MRIGIVGCGAITERGHLPALSRSDDFEVISAVDKNYQRAKSIAERFKIPNYYDDVDTMLVKTTPETVVVATPTPTHLDIALKCAEKGTNIIMEKPLSMDLEQCRRIYLAVKDTGINFSMIQNWRYLESAKLAKYCVTQGRYGKTVSFHGIAHTHYPTGWTRSRWLYHEKAVLFDFMPHLVDMLLWLLNRKARIVYAIGGDIMGEICTINYSNLFIDLEDGPSGFLETSWLTNAHGFSFGLRGTGGRMRLDLNKDVLEESFGPQTPFDDLTKCVHRMTKVVYDVCRGKLLNKAMKAYVDVYRDVSRHFARGQSPIPITEGVSTVALLEAAYKSITERRIVKISDLLEGFPFKL